MFKFSVFLILTTLSIAQADINKQIVELKKLSFLVGKWKGEGWFQQGRTERSKFTIHETVSYNLNNSILLVEGKGYDTKNKDKLIHHAFAVIRYDQKSNGFKIHTFKDGNYLERKLKVTDKPGFQWNIDIQKFNGKVRFTMLINDEGEWHEISEFLRDGKTFYKNMEMSLKKVE